MTLSIVPGDRKVHPDWTSTLHISNDGQRLFTTAFGLTNLGTTFAVARAQGHLLCTELPDYVTAPFVLKQTTGADLICGALKHYGDLTYFYGVLAEKVKTFAAPAQGKDIQEEMLWLSVKITSETLLSVCELVDTESAKLKTNFEKILACSPLFKQYGMTTVKKLEAHSQQSFEKNVKKMLQQLEIRLRKVAKENATTAHDAAESGGQGEDAKVRVEQMRNAMLSHRQFYSEPIIKRCFVVNFEALQESAVQFKGHQFEEQLTEALSEYAQASAELHAEIRVACTPMANLMAKLDTPAPAEELASGGGRSQRAKKPTELFKAGPAAGRRVAESTSETEEPPKDDLIASAASGFAIGVAL